MPVSTEGLENFVFNVLFASFAGLEGSLVVARLAEGLALELVVPQALRVEVDVTC